MQKSVALVLSSGGSRGLTQIGVINKLEEHGFKITSLAGSSIGSLIGGLYAMGKLTEYAEWLISINKRDVWGFMDFTFSTHGLLKGEKVFDKMKNFIPDMKIEDMAIPFAAVATDILNEKEVVFTQGSYYEAVRASIAIPAVFLPVEQKNSILIDGGVLHPVPTQFVVRNPGDLLVVVNLYGDKIEKKPADEKTDKPGYLSSMFDAFSKLIPTADKESMGYFSLLSATSSAMLQRIVQLSIEKAKPDIVINIPVDCANTFDFYKASQLIDLGAAQAEKAIQIYFETSHNKIEKLA